MPLPKTSDDRLADLQAVLSEIADPDLRLRAMWAAIEYGSAKFNEATDKMADAWQRSIDRHLPKKVA